MNQGIFMNKEKVKKSMIEWIDKISVEITAERGYPLKTETDRYNLEGQMDLKWAKKEHSKLKELL